MALSWTLSLTDKVSGPAKKVASALDRVSASMSKARSASTSLDKAQAVAGGSIGSRPNARRQSNPFEVGLGDIGASVAGAATAAGVGVAAGAVKLGMMVQDAGAFRQRTMFALETILKTKGAAEQAFAIAQRTALETGSDFRTSIGSFNTLLAQGFDVGFADKLVRSMADLRTLNPQANLEGITRAIGQIKTTGRLQGDELMQLAEAGLNVDAVYQEIAKSLGVVGTKGKTATQVVQDLQAKGQISSDVAIDAIQKAIAASTGGRSPGALAAERANQSLEGAIARARTLGEVFLGTTKVDWSPVSRAIDRATSALQGDAGQRFAERMGASMTRVVAVLDQITESDVEAFLDAAGTAFETVAGATERTAAGLRSVAETYSEVNVAFENATGITIAQAAADGLNGSLAITTGILSGISAVVEAAWSALATVRETAEGIGADLAEGFAEGIASGAGRVASAAGGLAGIAAGAFKSDLKIRSPSQVMRDMGRNTARGAALGITDELPRVERAGLSLASAPMQAGQAIRASVGGGSANTNRPMVNIENLHALDPAQALAEALREDLAS